MQHMMFSLSILLPCTALVATASAENTPEAACEQLNRLLTREVQLLRSVTDATTASASLPHLREVQQSLTAMDRSYEAEKALWTYIDNTEGVKAPLIEMLQRLTIEFMRLEEAAFFGNTDLESLLAPQLHAPAKEH